jgi:hypothetical protein
MVQPAPPRIWLTSNAPIECEFFAMRIRLPLDSPRRPARYHRFCGQTQPQFLARPITRADSTLTEFSQSSHHATAAPGSPAPIRVALIFSSKLERLGWGIVVSSQADMQVVGQYSAPGPALPFLTANRVDVALVDESLLTPAVCASIAKILAAGGPRFLLLARHSVDRSRYPFISGCLLNGVTAADFAAAIRSAR